VAPNLQRFFTDYADVSMSGDPARVAAFYAPNFIAAGPQGSMIFANDATFLEWLRGVSDFNRSAGMQSLAVVDIAGTELSERHTLATVTWGARFEKTGEQLITFAITYLLEAGDGGPKVIAYVSHADQEAEMKRHCLI
jgi:hypothetical protein